MLKIRQYDTLEGVRLYCCPHCSYESRTSLANVQRHVKYKHTKEKNFCCSFCPKRFVDKISMERHKRIHTGEKPFQLEEETVTKRSFRCPYCLYESHNSFGAVKRHIKYKHTGEKPFTCSICQMNFTEKCKLNQHTRTHTGEKPFQCDICLKGFGQSFQLKVHMYNHHEGK
ncbi:Zinc finger E-box-binding homeobox protein zag-1 [Armadillidium nasatum]|uniref:Zinc finger E-box-binding homeobox protein zag-1 n=1 Tax=Armadillidium nasatum TaxID=96803 RepID=A0A5N5TNJ6_9CRUS|nr:Zinc finger E-box-binding homeobox protein zag-1 [Armadillidium nasatum]